MAIRTDPEFKNLIPPLMKEERERLEDSIRNEGVREPLIVWNNILVDGHNRKEIADKLKKNYKIKGIKFKDRNAVILWIINNQLGRRNISLYDRTRLALRYEEIIKPKAKENMSKGGQGLTTLSKVNTRKELSKMSKTSEGTISKVKFIEQKATKETKDKLSNGTETINRVYTILKRQEKVKEIKKELASPIKLENKKYEIVYADPAWDYDRKVGEGIAEEQYKTSSLETIKKIPVNFITEKDAVLFMWVTFPMLREGLELMESWGFRYKTCAFNWIKLNKNGKPFFGIGYYTKSNSEICLLGLKGKGLTILDNTISQIIMTEKQIHSKKPEEVRNLIIQLFGDRKRIELFARQKVEGWDVHGDEI